MTETDIVARLRGLCSPAAEAMSDSERLTQLVVVGGRAATALAARGAEIEALWAEHRDDLRRTTEYGMENGRLALEWKHRAEAAERDRGRLREALENISAQETRYGNATVSRMTNIARAALQPQEPKP